MTEPTAYKRIRPETRVLLERAGFIWDGARHGWMSRERHRFVDFTTVRVLEEQDGDTLRGRILEEVVLDILCDQQQVPVKELLEEETINAIGAEDEVRQVLTRLQKREIGSYSTDYINDVELFTLMEEHWPKE